MAPPVAVVTPAPTPSPPPSPTPTPGPALLERDVLPAQTDPAITLALSAHFAVRPASGVTPAGRLFVMLPGTGAIPRFYREIVRTGATRGYHGIGLTYPNDVSVGDRCAASADPDCAGKVRREVVTGEDTSTLIAIPRAESIAGRLGSLIGYLERTYPGEGWGQFLVGGQPDWSKIVVAGHSQGGGHAGYMAKLFALERSVMFSAPGDTGLTAGSNATWYSLPNVTPLSRQFGFTHTGDELIPFGFVLLNWRAIGIDQFGGAVSVDGAAAPFGGSHQLSTSVPPNPAALGLVFAPQHASPAVDAATPLTLAGDLLYRPVWTYLAFP
ncbi:hypothetical protein [Novosphingobium sp. Gsoil 351]|uniref:BPSS1187 family protein n=1 Tax=Novosphingobium sp. Gsoil 351 TaxID=2675225 RepID=UPI0012B4A21C|nr:hypothetical protein [Novosphingobium sp. Gsoil 351]QGN53423.1 hypothetical protein GKE62_01505 [Novosphingobium sp. Gsoil 351]